jgi:hypothetical protein
MPQGRAKPLARPGIMDRVPDPLANGGRRTTSAPI